MNEIRIVSRMMIAFFVIQSPTTCQKFCVVDEVAVSTILLLTMVEA
jgi:hypothetical protein